IVYCLKKDEDYLVCVNASNADKDFAWMTKNNKGADITNESNYWAQIAIQGPKALALCDKVFGFAASQMKTFAVMSFKYKNFQCLFATTGYTGERGGEVFIEAGGAATLWQDLLKEGAEFQVQAIGLGARDTLRTEYKMSLYGHEIDDTSNPYEAKLGWAMKPAAKDFIGKGPMLKVKEAGLKKQLVGFKMLEKGIPRQGYSLFSFDNKEIGKVTSGTHSPTLDEPIGIGYVESEFAAEGTEFAVDIRGRKVKAKVCKTPFVTK
ncbi:MAG: glycine cleavage system aminomethyltransferase GcvT, partial [Proteobacteria bacterium]